MDLIQFALQEIALDGLEGSSFSALVGHLKARSPPIDTVIDDCVKDYIWKGLRDCGEVQAFLLDKNFNGNDQVATSKVANQKRSGETDTLPPDWIYDKDKNVCGYSPSYSHREDISEEIAELNLSEAQERYGDQLVLVASQDLRFRTLVGENYSPEMTGTVSPIRYIILEIIGKTRNEGFIQMDMKKYDFDPRTSFHHIKILLQSNLVTKQPRVIPIVPGRLIRTKLLFLKSFHRQSLKRSSIVAEKICAVLSDAPDGILELKELKKKVHLEPVLGNQFKRARQWLYGNGYIQYIYDGKVLKVEKQRLLASKPIHVQLVKMYEPEPDDVDNEDEVEENWVSRCKSLNPQLVNEINLDQHGYLVLTRLKEEGLTINELAEELCIPHFWGRSLLQNMHSAGHCSTIMLTKDKQRLKKVVSYLFLHKNKDVKTLKVLTSKCVPKSSEKEDLSEESEPGKAEVGSRSSPKSTNEDLARTSDDFTSEIIKTGELALQENRKLAESLNLRNFRYPNCTNDPARDARGLRRENFLLSAIQDAGVTSDHNMLYKALVKEEANEGLEGTCCRKSFFRTLSRMEKNGLISVHRFELPDLQQKPIAVYCSSGTKREDDAVKKNIEEVTFRLVRVIKEGTKRKASKDKDKPARQEQASAGEVETDTDNETHVAPKEEKKELRPLARFSRIKHLHLFLWQLLYGDRNEEGHTSFQGGKVNLCLNEKIEEFDFLNIKRKLPSYAKGDGWFKVGDVLSVIPLVLFGECGGMRVESKTFNSFMNNPKKRLMLMSEFPPKLSAKLLSTKEKTRFLGSLIHCLVIMVQLGLVRVVSDTLPLNRHESMLYLSKETLLLDTTESQRAYCEIALPPGLKEFPVLNRKLDTLGGVFKYWADLQFVCLNTPLGFCGKNRSRGVAKKRSDNPFGTLRDFKGIFSEENITTQEPRLLGDGRGAGGLESFLFAHLSRNWNYERIVRSRNANKNSLGATPTPKMEVPFAHAAALKKMKILKRKKLHQPKAKKKEADVKKGKVGTSINKGMPSSKVNKKLEGVVASRLLAFHQRHEALKRIKQQKKKHVKVLDEIDSKALGKRKGMRSVFSPKEDAMILYGVIASQCMKLSTKVNSPWEIVRNVMHQEYEESRDKTTESIQRRSHKILRYPETKAVMKAFVVECYDQEDFAYSRNFDNSNWKQYFADIFLKVRKKYKDQINPSPTTLSFPKSQEECQRDFVVKEMWDPKPTIKPPTNVTDVTRIVLKDLIHNSIAARQTPEFLPTAVFELFSCYPKEEIDRAVLDLKRRGLICRVKYDLPRHRGLPISTLRYDLSMWYDRSLDHVIPPKTYSLARQVRKGTLSLLECESGLRTEVDENACSLPCYHLEKGFFSHNQDSMTGGLIAYLFSLMARNEVILHIGIPDRTLRDRRELDAGKEHGSEKKVCGVSSTGIQENQDDSMNSNDISLPPVRTGIKRKRGCPDVDVEDAKKYCLLKRSSGSFSAINVTCAYLDCGTISFFRRTCVDQSHVDFAFSEKPRQSLSDSSSDIYRDYQPGRKFLSQLNFMLSVAQKGGKDVKQPTIKQDDFALIPFDVKFKEDIRPFYEFLPSLNVIGDKTDRSQEKDLEEGEVRKEEHQNGVTHSKEKLSSSICVRRAEEDASVISRFLQSSDLLPCVGRTDSSSERELDDEVYFSTLYPLAGFTSRDIDLNKKLYNAIRSEKELGATSSSLKRLFESHNSDGECKISLEMHLQQLMNFEKVMQVGALEKRYVAWDDRLAWCMKTPSFTTETMSILAGFKTEHPPSQIQKGEAMDVCNAPNLNKEALATSGPTEMALVSPVHPGPSASTTAEEDNADLDGSANHGETEGRKSSKKDKDKGRNKRKGGHLSSGGAKRSKVDAGENFKNELAVQEDGQPLNRVRRVTRMRPWLGLGGELSPLLLKRIQSAILSYISFCPGVTKKTLLEKYGFLLRPVALEEILQCLTLNKSITEHYLPEKIPQKGPFAKREFQVDHSNPYYLPTMSCFFNIVDVDRNCLHSGVGERK